MSRPNMNDLKEILNACLLRIQGGDTLEDVLADYPGLVEELRPVLETVVALMNARGSDTVPVAAMVNSRARLMKAVQQVKAAPPIPWWRRPLTLAGRGLAPVMALVIVAALVLTGIVSAESLPGQALYPVKLAAEQVSLSLPASPAITLTRQASYDQRRLDEVDQLINEKDEQEVDLSGFLTQEPATKAWLIDKIPLVVPPAQAGLVQQYAGHYVTIHGDVLPNGQIALKTITERTYNFSGQIKAVQKDRLSVGDIWINLNEETQVQGSIQVGAEAQVRVTRTPQGYLAVSVSVLNGEGPIPTHNAFEEKPGATETESGQSDGSESLKVSISPTPEASRTRESEDGVEKSPTLPGFIATKPTRSEQEQDQRTPTPEQSQEQHAPTATLNPGDPIDGQATRTPQPGGD